MSGPVSGHGGKAIQDSAVARRAERLTPRERQILRAIAHGKTDKDIAEQLGIKKNTVSSHVRNILKRLAARSRSHAVALWFVP